MMIPILQSLKIRVMGPKEALVNLSNLLSRSIPFALYSDQIGEKTGRATAEVRIAHRKTSSIGSSESAFSF